MRGVKCAGAGGREQVMGVLGRSGRRRVAVVLAGVLTASGAAVAVAPTASAAGAPVRVDFTSRGCSTWTVPAQVTSVTAVAVGSAGAKTSFLFGVAAVVTASRPRWP